MTLFKNVSILQLLHLILRNGILPLNVETLLLLEEKHPKSKEASDNIMIQGPLERIHPIAYDMIEETLVLSAAVDNKGGSGPSGMDAYGCHRILASSQYGTASSDLRKAFAEVIKNMCSKNSLELQCNHIN